MSEKSNEVISILEDINLKLRVEVQLKDTRIKALEAALLEFPEPTRDNDFHGLAIIWQNKHKALLESIRRE